MAEEWLKEYLDEDAEGAVSSGDGMRDVYWSNLASRGGSETANPIFLEPSDFVSLDPSCYLACGTRIPVDKEGLRTGYVVSVSDQSHTAVVAVMRDVAGKFPRLSV